ncbi:MAG: DUF4296 domain-containing protein [Candidatus Cryptobacteroides sp.]|nr:DUF4296 domain-containing protein [Bacteroidales bacterium]MDY6157769.1 DUF4296 domain-containing protein [Candidatus Cryptobacteroides sp.]
MPKRGTTVALMLLSFALAFSSCSKGGRVLSEHKMEMLYTDMFLADQWLRDHPKYRAMADTTLFFDPIFEKHNITFEDYDASLKYYVSKPELLAEITQKASARLSKMADIMSKEVERLAEIDRTNKANRISHEFVDFESLEPRSEYFSFTDSVSVHSDSLALALDSLSFAPDSLTYTRDSLAFAPDPLAAKEVSHGQRVGTLLRGFDSVKVAPRPFSRPDSASVRKRLERITDKHHKE